MRFCGHCNKEITYPVYKKHKEELIFMILRKKEWKVKCKLYDEEIDAKDDAVIMDSLAQCTTGCSSSNTLRDCRYKNLAQQKSSIVLARKF